MELDNLQRGLLKRLILDESRRPDTYTFRAIYRMYDYEKHTEQEIKECVQSLVDKKLLLEKGGSYSLSREAFLNLKKQYRYRIFFNSRDILVLFPFVIALVASLFSATGSFDFFDSKERPTQQTWEQKIELKIASIEAQINEQDSINNFARNNLDSLEVYKGLISIQTQNKSLSNDVAAIKALIQDNPNRVIEIASLKKDLDDVKNQIASNTNSLQRDVDRISSYNNTLIVFMITFLVAYIGFGIFTAVNKNKNDLI